MRIKATIKGFRRCQGLTIELQDSNGTIIAKADNIIKNRFNLKLNQSPF
ncbi:hypothetical protein SynA1524_00425 [Synechococcus sp. A15-24]|nr:hypothetical protein SynA1524_00425 [Synechococcus sp. A15-24]